MCLGVVVLVLKYLLAHLKKIESLIFTDFKTALQLLRPPTTPAAAAGCTPSEPSAVTGSRTSAPIETVQCVMDALNHSMGEMRTLPSD